MKEALLIFAVGIGAYFTKGPHLIDFFITAVAFGLEMGFFLSKQYSNNSQAATLTHLITILLVWRVVRAPLQPALALFLLNSCTQVRLLHGLMETTMAVQNHDAALHEKEMLETDLDNATRMVHDLQDRVRQLEIAFESCHLPAGAPKTTARSPSDWSPNELKLVEHAFRTGADSHSLAITSAQSDHMHNTDPQHKDTALSHQEAQKCDTAQPLSFRADYFCTWLTTHPDAKGFGVVFRSHAVACGAAMMNQKAI
jgi:hypothetical protein